VRCHFLALASTLLGGCSGCDGDGAVDAFVTDIDNGSCGDQLRFTGEYVDWDTHTSFCGIGEAVVEVPGGAMDTTAPNGRFDLCIPRTSPTTKLTITQPPNMSQCTNPPAGYTVPTIFHAHRDVILAGGFFSGRAFTTARQASYFQTLGIAFDATKAQVFVHVNGTMPRQVTLAAAQGPAQAINANAWGPGDTGKDVFFPNVDVGGGTTMLSSTGAAIGTGSIPLAAGTITNVSILLQ
jgi:hypothetical protein